MYLREKIQSWIVILWSAVRSVVVGKRLGRYRTWLFQVYVLAVLAVFCVLALLAGLTDYFPFDLELTRELQHEAPAWIGQILAAVSWFGYPLQAVITVSTTEIGYKQKSREAILLKHILIHLPAENIPQKTREHIQNLTPEYKLIITNDKEEIEPILETIEIAAVRFPPGWFTRAPNLRWYQQWGAGTDWLLQHPDIAQMDFTLTNASGVHAIPISEHIVAMMLAFSRQLPAAFQAQSRREWLRDVPAFELAGSTMLLIGVGAIGQRTAQIASALGMRVIGIRRNPSDELLEVDQMVGPDALLDVLPEADFVVLTVPLTEDTRQMLNTRAFKKMKSSAYVINIGRGGTIDEEAMIQALRSGAIAGAGLDVFGSEPLPADSPLWGMENVIITAHYSGNTPYYDERALEIFVDNLERYVSGKPLRNVVDKQAGY